MSKAVKIIAPPRDSSVSMGSPSSPPRMPRYPTPYPHRAPFLPATPSPLSSPGATLLLPDIGTSPNALPLTPHPHVEPHSMEHSPILHAGHTPAFPVPQVRVQDSEGQETAAKRSVPITLRMTSLSPTDSIFEPNHTHLLSTTSLSPVLHKIPLSQKIPLSPSAKRYMEDKENRKRPDPIFIPRIAWRDDAAGRRPGSGRAMSARLGGYHEIRGRGEVKVRWDCAGGCVPFPRTPFEAPERTAMPLTAKRIGRVQLHRNSCTMPRFEQKTGSSSPKADETAVAIEQGVLPLLRRATLPG